MPISTVLEITGILTLLTNESLIGPVGLDFSIPFLISADIQGFGLLFLGGALTTYAVTQMKK